MKTHSRLWKLCILTGLALLVGCSGRTSGPNSCTSSAQCPGPNNDGGSYVCSGFCNGDLSQSADFLADGGIGFQVLADGGLASSCPSGKITGAACTFVQCVVAHCN